MRRNPLLGFAYRLALKLGISNVWDWLEDLPWPQFREWMMFEEVNGPWGSRREELVTAISGETIINELRMLNYHVSVYMAGKEARKVPKPEMLQSGDLLPKFGERYQEQEQQEQATDKRVRGQKKRVDRLPTQKQQKGQKQQQQDAYYQLWLADKEARKRVLEQQQQQTRQPKHRRAKAGA